MSMELYNHKLKPISYVNHSHKPITSQLKISSFVAREKGQYVKINSNNALRRIWSSVE